MQSYTCLHRNRSCYSRKSQYRIAGLDMWFLWYVNIVICKLQVFYWIAKCRWLLTSLEIPFLKPLWMMKLSDNWIHGSGPRLTSISGGKWLQVLSWVSALWGTWDWENIRPSLPVCFVAESVLILYSNHHIGSRNTYDKGWTSLLPVVSAEVFRYILFPHIGLTTEQALCTSEISGRCANQFIQAHWVSLSPHMNQESAVEHITPAETRYP